MLKKLKIFCFIILSFIFISVFSNDLYALSNSSLNLSAMADSLISQGIGSNVANTLITGGFLDKDARENYESFVYNFSKNNNFYFAREILTGEKNPFYDSANDSARGIYDLYKSIVAEMEKSEDMKYFFDKAKTYSGIGDDDYAKSVIEAVSIQVVSKIAQEIDTTYKKGCKDSYTSSKATFEYGGKSYKCSDIYYEYTMFGPDYGTEHFIQEFSNPMIGSVSADLSATAGNLSDTMTQQIQSSTFYTGTQEKNTTIYVDDDGKIQFAVADIKNNYYPNLINVIRFSNNFKNSGELKELTKTDSGDGSKSILQVSIDIINQFSKYGVYIFSAIIIALGVRMIWAGVEGRTQFFETLPYILVAIVLFYCAPGIISVLKEVFNGAYDIEEQTKSIFGTVVSLARILAFAGIVFNGTKLMFTGVYGRANLKASVIAVLIGCIFVFASSYVVQIVINSANDVEIQNNSNIQSIE